MIVAYWQRRVACAGMSIDRTMRRTIITDIAYIAVVVEQVSGMDVSTRRFLIIGRWCELRWWCRIKKHFVNILISMECG